MFRYRSFPSHAARSRRGERIAPWSRRSATGRHRAAGRARRRAALPTASRHRRPSRRSGRASIRLLPAALGMTLAAAVVSSWFAVGGAVAMAAMLR